jgi:hypothetical protein
LWWTGGGFGISCVIIRRNLNRHLILATEPSAKVDKLATLAAEGEPSLRLRSLRLSGSQLFDRLFADGAQHWTPRSYFLLLLG